MSDTTGKIRNCTVYFPQFRAYYQRHPAWGSLHIVLDDGNVSDGHVRWCREWASERNDQEGAALADLLLRMSETQRLRIHHECVRW